MENSSEVLYTMERLVSSLLEVSSGAAETIKLGVFCSVLNGEKVATWFPSWETNKQDDFKEREAVFTNYPTVSVVFKSKAVILFGKHPDQTFDGMIFKGNKLVDAAEARNPKNTWTLVSVKTTTRGENFGKPYGLTYSCNGMEMDLEERTHAADMAADYKQQKESREQNEKIRNGTYNYYHSAE